MSDTVREEDWPNLRAERYYRNLLTQGIAMLQRAQPQALDGISERDIACVIRCCLPFLVED